VCKQFFLALDAHTHIHAHTQTGESIHYSDQIQLSSLKFANIFLSTFQPSDAVSEIPLSSSTFPTTHHMSPMRRPQSPSTRGFRDASPTSGKSDSGSMWSRGGHDSSQSRREAAITTPTNLEVNGSAETYQFQVRPVRSWKSWRMWAGKEIDDDQEDAVEAVFGMDIVKFTRASAGTVLYGDPESSNVWWAPAVRLDKDAARRDQRICSVNAYWRIQPHLTDHAGERLKSRSGARVILQHVASGYYLCDSGGTSKLSALMRSPQNVWQLPSSAVGDEEAREYLSDGSVVWIKKEKPSGFSERWLGLGRKVSLCVLLNI